MEIALEWREQLIFVRLYGSGNDQPLDAIFSTRVRASLEDILTLRVPEKKIDWSRVERPLGDETASRIVRHYSECLRDHAQDMLNGDFTAFPAIEQLMKHRRQVADTTH